ncbi:MAG: XRE family transcriptional regulator [Salinibacterium sp.]|nr:MAG: XRE family transcriptional regulator [Salinibacterium sp.]
MPSARIIALRPNARPSDLDLAIGQAISRLRRSRRLSEAVLAARLGRGQEFIASIESGRARISAAMLVEVARGLGISGSALLQEADAHRNQADS